MAFGKYQVECFFSFKTELESCIVSCNYFQAALILYGQGNPIVANDNCSSEVSKILPELLVTAPNERKKVIIIPYPPLYYILLYCIPSITTGCTGPEWDTLSNYKYPNGNFNLLQENKVIL